MIDVTCGNSPIVLGFGHTGTDIPADIASTMTPAGQAMADTAWHLDRLYKDLGLDLTRVRAPVHRYVVDVNRCADETPLYTDRRDTGLCPITTFDGQDIYLPGMQPDQAERRRRVAAYHTPYHQALRTELDRLRHKHGAAVLFDCHSTRSVIPTLFDDTLPDLNIGTNLSASCSISVERSVHTRCRAAPAYSCALNDRFYGGWTIRSLGQPSDNIHAIQLDIAQRSYMDETAPWHFRADKAELLRPVIYRVLSDLIDFVQEKLVY